MAISYALLFALYKAFFYLASTLRTEKNFFLCYFFFFFLFGSIVLISLKYEHVYAFAIVYARTGIKHLGMFYLGVIWKEGQ